MARWHRGLVALCCCALFLCAATPAHAGGASWKFEPGTLQPGERALAWIAISWAHNPALGSPADGPWYAWLQPMHNGEPNPPRIRDDAIPLGEITVREGPYSVGDVRFGPNHATVEFIVPDLPDGNYELAHCNDPCTKYLADITSGFVQIGDGVPPPLAPDAVAASVDASPPATSAALAPVSRSTAPASTSGSADDRWWGALGAGVLLVGGAVFVALRRATRQSSTVEAR